MPSLKGTKMGLDVHQKRKMEDADDPNPMAKRALRSIYLRMLDRRKSRIIDWRRRKALERKWHDAQALQAAARRV